MNVHIKQESGARTRRVLVLPDREWSSPFEIVSFAEHDQTVLVCLEADENRWEWRLLRKKAEGGNVDTVFGVYVTAGTNVDVCTGDGLTITVGRARITAPTAPFRLFEADDGFLMIVGISEPRNAYYFGTEGELRWRVAENPWKPLMAYAGVEQIEDHFALVIQEAARGRYDYVLDLSNGTIVAERDRLDGRIVDALAGDQPMRYRPKEHRLPPTFTGNALEGIWSRAAAAAFNLNNYPSLYDPNTLTDRTLLAPGTDSPLRMFLIPMNELLEDRIHTAIQLKERYSLPLVPTTLIASRGYPAGATFAVGVAAANQWGSGGGAIVFGNQPAELTGGEMPVELALQVIRGSKIDPETSAAHMLRLSDRTWGTRDIVLDTTTLGDHVLVHTASERGHRYVLMENDLLSQERDFPRFAPSGWVDVHYIAEVREATDPAPLFRLVNGPAQIVELDSGYAVCQWGRRDAYNVTFFDRTLTKRWIVGRDPWGYHRPIEFLEVDGRGRLIGWIADRYRAGLEIDVLTGDVVALLDAETRSILDQVPPLSASS